MTALVKLTNPNPDMSGVYLSTTIETLDKGWEEIGASLGYICTGNYFIFQEVVGNVYDLAWVLDEFKHENVALLWSEKTGLGILTGITEGCVSKMPPSFRIVLGLPPEDHKVAQSLLNMLVNG